MGKRTRNEIDVEKFAMKALRGDFEAVAYNADREIFAKRVIGAVKSYGQRRYSCG